ncbi:unnamed protein product [Caenorhabditis nigoni]
MHPESSRNDKRRTAFDGLHRWTVVPGQLGWQGILSDLMRTTIFSTSKLDEDHQVSQKIGKEDDLFLPTNRPFQLKQNDLDSVSLQDPLMDMYNQQLPLRRSQCI